MTSGAGAASARYVLESALSALVHCLPSVAGAEVWQFDDGGVIRCTLSRAADGGFCQPNRRVDRTLCEADAQAIRREAESARGSPDEGRRVDPETPPSSVDGNDRRASGDPPGGRLAPGGDRAARVFGSSQTRGLLAVGFTDPCFKVGDKWVGGDRLARGFALVAPLARAAGSAGMRCAATTDGTPQHLPVGPVPARDAPAAKGGGGKGRVEDGRFMAELAAEVDAALSRVRARERGAAARALSLSRLSALCSRDHATRSGANEAVLAEISRVLPGCCAYVGALQPGGDSILYEAATPNSSMIHRVLRRGEGVSFHCLDSPLEEARVVRYRPSPVHEKGTPSKPSGLSWKTVAAASERPGFVAGAEVEVWYASTWLPGRVTRDRGHGFYDVRYDGFDGAEAGVPGWRLRDSSVPEHHQVKLFEGSPRQGETPGDRPRLASCSSGGGSGSVQGWPWPFVCLPLRHGGNRLGVLGVDGWAAVPRCPGEEAHPGKAVLAFLKKAGALLSAVHHKERRREAITTLGSVLRGKDASEEAALEAMIALLREAITFRVQVDVLEMPASEPGMAYRRGVWAERPAGPRALRDDRKTEDDGAGCDTARRGQRTPSLVQVFAAGDAPTATELCVAPSPLGRFDGGGEPAPSPSAGRSGEALADYQREVHELARERPGAPPRKRVKAMESRRGEIVGRFRRLVVRSSGGRPSQDGWYMVRVLRRLPDTPRARPVAPASWVYVPGGGTGLEVESGDLDLLSEACGMMEEGFMSMASREQRARTRAKALERILACCRDVSVDAPPGRLPRASGGDPAPAASASDKAVPGLGGALEARDELGGQRRGVVAAGSFKREPAPGSLAPARAVGIEEGRRFVFSAPVSPPTPAETLDARKGSLVALRDGRLGVLVAEGERSAVAVELPGGRQEIVPASEVRRVGWVAGVSGAAPYATP